MVFSDTRNGWPGGRKVLIGTHWIDRIDWATKEVFVRMTRDQVKDSPQQQVAVPLTREYETWLHQVDDRQGSWA